MKMNVLAVGAVVAAALCSSAYAVDYKCEPPVLNAGAESSALYSIQCEVGDTKILAPRVLVSGEMAAGALPPYKVQATYQVDTRSVFSAKLGVAPRIDQVAAGSLVTATQSVAALPSQLATKLVWDAQYGALSIEVAPGKWQVFGVAADELGESGLMDAGVSSSAVKEGKGTYALALDSAYSRFAAKGVDAPKLTVILGLRDGKLEVLQGDTRVQAQSAVQGALSRLDKNPKDMGRAWALAALGKFLGLTEEVRYAEQRVAAHNPQHLQEFQAGLLKITPYQASLK